jgi:hypothetical protein
VRRHQKSGSTTNNLTATHRTQLLGCVATKNLEAPPIISQRRTPCTRVRETGFLRVAVRNRFFLINRNWEAKIVTKTRFLIAAGGQKKPGFFDKSKLGSKDCGKNPVSDFRHYMAARIPMMI